MKTKLKLYTEFEVEDKGSELIISQKWFTLDGEEIANRKILVNTEEVIREHNIARPVKVKSKVDPLSTALFKNAVRKLLSMNYSLVKKLSFFDHIFRHTFMDDAMVRYCRAILDPKMKRRWDYDKT